MEKHFLCFFLLDSSSLSPVPYSSVPSAYCLVLSARCPLPAARCLSPCSMLYASFATDNGLRTTDARLGTPVAYDYLGCCVLCIAIASQYFVEFPNNNYDGCGCSPTTS